MADTEYYGAFRFEVAIHDPGSDDARATGAGASSASAAVTVAGFSEVGGLVFETDVLTLREGGANDAEVQLAGPRKYSARVVLKRGIGEAADLWDWYQESLAGVIRRRQIDITMRLATGERGLTWNVRDACPVKWTGPELRAGTSAVAFESLEFIHRGFSMAGDL